MRSGRSPRRTTQAVTNLQRKERTGGEDRLTAPCSPFCPSGATALSTRDGRSGSGRGCVSAQGTGLSDPPGRRGGPGGSCPVQGKARSAHRQGPPCERDAGTLGSPPSPCPPTVRRTLALHVSVPSRRAKGVWDMRPLFGGHSGFLKENLKSVPFLKKKLAQDWRGFCQLNFLSTYIAE